MGHASHQLGLHSTHPIIRPVGGKNEIAEPSLWVEEEDLDVLPILLIDGSVELDALIEPLGLPSDLIVRQRIGSELERRLEGSIQMQRRIAVESARAKPL